MNYYSYLVEHDFGLAPNPFGGYCTLTVCKPIIRKSSKLRIGDWIIGTGSVALSRTFGRKLKQQLFLNFFIILANLHLNYQQILKIFVILELVKSCYHQNKGQILFLG